MNEDIITYDKSFEAVNISSFGENIVEEKNDFEQNEILKSNYIQVGRGEHVQSFSARVLDWDTEIVKTEFLINKEEGLYQVRLFPVKMFEGTNFLKHNQLLKVFLFVKRGESSIKFEDGTKLVDKDDFPLDNSLSKLDSPLFKFK